MFYVTLSRLVNMALCTNEVMLRSLLKRIRTLTGTVKMMTDVLFLESCDDWERSRGIQVEVPENGRSQLCGSRVYGSEPLHARGTLSPCDAEGHGSRAR